MDGRERSSDGANAISPSPRERARNRIQRSGGPHRQRRKLVSCNVLCICTCERLGPLAVSVGLPPVLVLAVDDVQDVSALERDSQLVARDVEVVVGVVVEVRAEVELWEKERKKCDVSNIISISQFYDLQLHRCRLVFRLRPPARPRPDRRRPFPAQCWGA